MQDENTPQGHIANTTPPGTTPSHERATFSDPLPGNVDPTSPASPETTLAYQHEDREPTHKLSGVDQPQQNIEDWRRTESEPDPDA